MVNNIHHYKYPDDIINIKEFIEFLSKNYNPFYDYEKKK